MRISRLIATAALAAATAGLSAALPAQAATPAGQARSCFFSRDWNGWTSPQPDMLYLKVNVRDVYRVDLVGKSSQLRWPSSHLINRISGSPMICSPIDLNLGVSDGHGFVEPLFVKALTKLTPEEVAAIPKKYRP